MIFLNFLLLLFGFSYFSSWSGVTSEPLLIDKDLFNENSPGFFQANYGLVSNSPNHHGLMRRAVDPNACDGTTCTAISVTSSFSFTNNCETLVCYSITNKATGAIITGIDIFDGAFPMSGFSASIPGWVSYSCGSLTWSGTVTAVDSSYCFKLPGKYAAKKGTALIHVGDLLCSYSIQVPDSSVPCGKDCILDNNIEKATCQDCPAICSIPGAANAIANRYCTLKVLINAKQGGRCSSIVKAPCTKPCPVDCTVTGPLYRKCTANCDTQTVTMTPYYSTIVAQSNGGKPCSSSSGSLSVCSLSPADFGNICAQNCLVAGYVTNPCVQGCLTANGVQFSASATYPTTVRSARGTGKACPTFSTVCLCSDCALGPTPTALDPCDARCTVYNDKHAFGSQRIVFPTTLPGTAGVYCNTARHLPCSVECLCRYTSYSIDQICTITSTVTDFIPWIATGFQTARLFATNAECNKNTELPCSTILSPINCDYRVDCPSTYCNSLSVDEYTITTSSACTISTINQPLYGGNACPTDPVSTTISKVCSGCKYDTETCGCKYSSTVTNADGKTTYSGYRSCTYPPLNNANGLCLAKTSLYQATLCSTVGQAPNCIYEPKICDACVLQSTTIVGGAYYSTGTKSCTYTDIRPTSVGQITCLSSVSAVSCSSSLSPIDCTVAQLCSPCLPSCHPTSSGTASTTAICSIYKLKTNSFGGVSCPTTSTTTTACTKTCTPITSTVCPLKSCCKFNLLAFGNVIFISSDIQGKVAVGGDGSFFDSNIALNSNKPFPDCNNKCPGLYVAGTMYMDGKVYSGNVYSGKECYMLPENTACNYTCNYMSNDCFNDEKMAVDFNSIYSDVVSLSTNLQTNTAPITVDLSQPLSCTNTVRLSYIIPAIKSNPMPLIRFSNIPPLTTTIIFTILGTNVVIRDHQYAYMKNSNSKIIFNFPQATSIEITRTTIYAGLFIAPLATLTGDGAIKGQVFVKSVLGVPNNSLTFKWIEFDGNMA